MGVSEMPEVFLGTRKGAQEEFVRFRDLRVVWSSLLAQFKATHDWEVGKVSAGLPNFAAVASLLQIKGVRGNGSLKQFGTKAAVWVRDVGLVLSSSFARAWHPTARSLYVQVLCCLGTVAGNSWEICAWGEGTFGTGSGMGGTAADVGCSVGIIQAKQTSGRARKGARRPSFGSCSSVMDGVML